MADRDRGAGEWETATTGLNEQQRAAVEFRDGPLAVLAGPGTGKTRVITHRVERIIREGAPPERIVALTFTVKAAEQLRERLAALVGPSAADRVNAHTFHGFGLRLIRRFSDMLGLPPDVRLIDGPRVRKRLRDLIVEHGLYADRVAEGRESAAADAGEAIHGLANNGTFPDEATAFAARWAARLGGPDHALDPAALEAERARAVAFAEHARLYGLFHAACVQRGTLTFDDLILLPIRLLRERESAAALCRDDYRHFVVDEFQDVNPAQIELLKLLAPPGRERGRRGPDLCVVGDDDQSIYGFRGADERAFAKFEREWRVPASARVPLSQNYRSERPIVEVANAVMTEAEERFAPEKIVELPVEKRGTKPKAGAAVEGITLEDDSQAGEVIAAMILEEEQRSRAEGREGSATPQGRAIHSATSTHWGRFAVIARSHGDLDRIGALLQLEGIPVRRSRGASALGDRGVQDVLAWVQMLVLPAPDPNVTLATRWLLTRPPFSVPGDRASELTIEYAATRPRRGDGRAAGPGFLDWLVMRDDPRWGPPVARLRTLRDELRTAAAQMRADAVVFEVLRRTDVAHAELLPGRERAARVTHLVELLRFVKDNADALDPPGDLAAFWSFYQELTDTERELRSGADGRVDGGESDADDSRDAVMLLTAHAAKGLEFDTVFVPRVRPGHGYPSSPKGDEEELPEGLVDRAGDTRSRRGRQGAEERRLFYVACTRAERRLVLLADARKSRTEREDYFNELTMDPPGNRVVVSRSAAEVLANAAQAGVRLASRGLTGATDTTPCGPDAAREILDHARRGARIEAARALDAVDRPDATPEMIRSAVEALRDAAERTAVAAAVGAGESPAWAAGPMGVYAARLAEAVQEGPEDALSAIFKPLTAPLKLSYSSVSDYHRCPRCFYLKNVLGFPEPEDRPRIVGQVVHKALAAFSDRGRTAEAAGAAGPGLDELLALGRDEFERGAAGGGGRVDGAQLEQVLAQLRLWHQKLHDPRDEVELVERFFPFGYPHEGADGRVVVHSFQARIDRLDRLPGPAAGHRIVDYKSGQAWKYLLEPRRDDLQLGVYAMAVRWHQDGGGDQRGGGAERAAEDLLRPAVGIAEYQLLATGERGRIDLKDIDYVKVKQRIDEAVTGMLTGMFPRGKECWGLCRMVV